MVESRSSAAHASVVFLRIRDFSREPVAERAALKGALEGMVASSIAALDEGDRIVLDAPDGCAVVVLGNPRGALAFADRSLLAARDLPLAIGIDHGPVRVAGEEGAEALVVGDGVSVASAIADFAVAGRILASRAFRKVLFRIAPDLGRHLSPAGMFTDRQDRAHELYFADAGARATRRRRVFLLATLGAVGILGAGVAGRAVLQRVKPAVIEFDVLPQGDVFVDGIAKGRTPPLTRLQLAPGRHTVELRNPRFKPVVVDVEVNAGEQMTIKHWFTAPSNPKPAKRGFFDWFK